MKAMISYNDLILLKDKITDKAHSLGFVHISAVVPSPYEDDIIVQQFTVSNDKKSINLEDCQTLENYITQILQDHNIPSINITVIPSFAMPPIITVLDLELLETGKGSFADYFKSA